MVKCVDLPLESGHSGPYSLYQPPSPLPAACEVQEGGNSLTLPLCCPLSRVLSSAHLWHSTLQYGTEPPPYSLSTEVKPRLHELPRTCVAPGIMLQAWEVLPRPEMNNTQNAAVHWHSCGGSEAPAAGQALCLGRSVEPGKYSRSLLTPQVWCSSPRWKKKEQCLHQSLIQGFC